MLGSHWYSKLPLVALLASSTLVLLVALLRHADARVDEVPATPQKMDTPAENQASAKPEPQSSEAVAEESVAVVPPSPLTLEEAPSLTVPVPSVQPTSPMSPEALAKDPLFQEMRKLLSQPNSDLDIPPIEVTSPLDATRSKSTHQTNAVAIGLERMESVQQLANASIQLLQEAQALEAVGQPVAAAELKMMAEQLRTMIARLAH